MKYNINLKNVQVQNVASIEALEVNVEYSVGEIPEILGHVLPFIECVSGEIIPNLVERFVQAKVQVQQAEAQLTQQKRQAEIKDLEKLAEVAKAMSEIQIGSDRAQTKKEEFEASFEDMLSKAGYSIGAPFLADSPKTLGELLRDRLKESAKAKEAAHRASSADGSFWD